MNPFSYKSAHHFVGKTWMKLQPNVGNGSNSWGCYKFEKHVEGRRIVVNIVRLIGGEITRTHTIFTYVLNLKMHTDSARTYCPLRPTRGLTNLVYSVWLMLEMSWPKWHSQCSYSVAMSDCDYSSKALLHFPISALLFRPSYHTSSQTCNRFQ